MNSTQCHNVSEVFKPPTWPCLRICCAHAEFLVKHSEAFAEQGQAFVFWSPESFQANIAWTIGGKILSKQARHPSWHCQFSCVLGVSLTSVFLNSRWMAISTGFCEERVLIPHHTIFEEVVGKWFIHKASIGSISCGMFCVGARRGFPKSSPTIWRGDPECPVDLHEKVWALEGSCQVALHLRLRSTCCLFYKNEVWCKHLPLHQTSTIKISRKWAALVNSIWVSSSILGLPKNRVNSSFHDETFPLKTSFFSQTWRINLQILCRNESPEKVHRTEWMPKNP